MYMEYIVRVKKGGSLKTILPANAVFQIRVQPRSFWTQVDVFLKSPILSLLILHILFVLVAFEWGAGLICFHGYLS